MSKQFDLCTIGSFCGNCCTPFENETIKTSVFDFGSDEVQIIDAIEFIYGIPWHSFLISSEISTRNELLRTCSENGNDKTAILLCNSCSILLSSTFTAFKKLESVTHSLSVLKKIDLFRRQHWSSVETQDIEDITSFERTQSPTLDDVNDDDLVESFNFEDELEEPQQIDIKNSEVEIKYSIESENNVELEEKSNSPQTNKSKKCEKSITDSVVHVPRVSLRLREAVVKLERLDYDFIKPRRAIRKKSCRLQRPRIKESLNLSKETPALEKETSTNSSNNANQLAANCNIDVTRKYTRKAYTKSKPYVCKICGLRFRNRAYYLHDHLPKHYGKIDRVQCEICKKSVNKKYLKNHIKVIHTKEDQLNSSDNNDVTSECAVNSSVKGRIYKCKICGKRYRDREYYLYQHLPKHYGTGGQCEICKKVVEKKNLKDHIKTMHANNHDEKEKSKVACEICGKTMAPYTLKTHMNSVHARTRNPFKCNTCEKEYLNKRSYSEHILTHSDQFTPHLCVKCGRSFKKLSAFRVHEKMHSRSEEQYLCTLCPRKFFIKASLKVHLLTHSTERQFICDECGKTFKFRPHLTAHLKLHAEVAEKGEYSIKCDLCGKSFKHSQSLSKHKLRIHPVDPVLKKTYACSFCGKMLSSLNNLRIHEDLHKNNSNYKPRKKQEWASKK